MDAQGQILVGAAGRAVVERVAGVAVGIDEHGRQHVTVSDLTSLTPADLGALYLELEGLQARLLSAGADIARH